MHTLTSDLTATTGERDELQARVDEQARELASLHEQLLAQTRRAEEATVRADRERASADRAIGQLETAIWFSVSQRSGSTFARRGYPIVADPCWVTEGGIAATTRAS